MQGVAELQRIAQERVQRWWRVKALERKMLAQQPPEILKKAA